MKFVEEVVVEEFLPTFRSLLAERLRDEGLTQSAVAELLGISQSAVSKYVHGAVERNEELLASTPLLEHVDRLAAGLASGETSRVQALVETEVLIRELERGGALARLHEAAEPDLADLEGGVAVHDPESTLREAERALSAVRRGLGIVENASGFAALIPAVGSNLVQGVPDADGIEDVAGVPGRILDVKGRATIPADPEFGASEHVASLLLAARSAGSDATAALNVGYDDELLASLEDRGLVAAEFDPEADLETAVDEALTRHADADRAVDDETGTAAAATAVDVLYQTGGFGVEPVLYVLGPDAATVAETVRDVL